MTTQELIEKLKQLPPETRVLTWTAGRREMMTENVKVCRRPDGAVAIADFVAGDEL